MPRANKYLNIQLQMQKIIRQSAKNERRLKKSVNKQTDIWLLFSHWFGRKPPPLKSPSSNVALN